MTNHKFKNGDLLYCRECWRRGKWVVIGIAVDVAESGCVRFGNRPQFYKAEMFVTLNGAYL